MNLASQAEDEESNLLFVNFNQDCSSIAVGSKTGYKLFSLNSVEKLDLIYDSESDDICIVERLFSSSLVAIVSLSSPRKLKVCHFKKGTEICNYSYSNSILAVKLNRQRLIVCLEESLYIHNIRDMKVLHTIRETPSNPAGLCALSINNDNCFLAYPGSSSVGEVQIFDTINLRAVSMIAAHDNKLVALAFNAQGTKIATASEKGTVIRVFSVPDGQKLFEFRRGMKRCVHIHSLAFSSDSAYLLASSNTETVHIFKLEVPKESKPQDDQSSWMGYFGQALKTPANYLPQQVAEMFNQERAFAICKLPNQGLKNVCAIASIQKIPRLLVACQDGNLYIYNLDPNEGGECMLLRQHSLDGKQRESGHGSEPPTGAGDRPLTQASNPITYAGSLKRVETTSDGTPPSAPTGKPVPVAPTVPLSTSPVRLESYATVLQLSKGGPQEVGLEFGDNGVSEIDIILAGRAAKLKLYHANHDISEFCNQCELKSEDSQPFQDFDTGATGQDFVAGAGLNALRLDDDNEFPPMTHKVD